MHIEAVHGHQIHMKDAIGCLSNILRKYICVVHEQRGYFPTAIIHKIFNVFGITGRNFQVPHDVDVILSEFHCQRVDEACDARRIFKVIVPRLDAAGTMRLSAREEYWWTDRKKLLIKVGQTTLQLFEIHSVL